MADDATDTQTDDSAQHALLALLSDEITQQRSEYLARASGLNSRATILVTAASIVVALQSPDLDREWTIIATIFGALSAGFALAVLWPRGRKDNKALELEEELWNSELLSMKRTLLHRQAEILKKKDDTLRRRGRRMAYGFACFGGMVGSSALAIVLSR